VALHLPDACLTTDPRIVLALPVDELTPVYEPDKGLCAATFSWTANFIKGPAEHRRLEAVMPKSGYLLLKQRTYPAWQIKVNGQTVDSLPRRDDGLMVVPVPQGPVILTVDWTTTKDVIAGRWLSLIALAVLTYLCLLERKSAKPRLS
jgi:hypothetical protein